METEAQRAWFAWSFWDIRQQSLAWSPGFQSQYSELFPLAQSIFSLMVPTYSMNWNSACVPCLRHVVLSSLSKTDFCLFFSACLKYFIILQCTNIKRLSGRPRLPMDLGIEHADSDQREMSLELFKERSLLSWILLTGRGRVWAFTGKD